MSARPNTFPNIIGQRQCAHGCRDAELGQACSLTAEVYPTGNEVTLCAPSSQCDDAVMHRTADRDWHTCQGVDRAALFLGAAS